MSSSPRNPISPVRDIADGFSAGIAWALVLALGGAMAYFGGRLVSGPISGEILIFPEIAMTIASSPMPAIEIPAPEPVAEPPREILPEPEMERLPEPVVAMEPERQPEPVPELIAPSPPAIEPAPVAAAQSAVEEEGDSGEEDATRAEWLSQLRRRIEESKYYPGTARYSRETGTVLLRVEIRADGEIGNVRILENTGSALLAEGARGILRRATERPLGTEALSRGFEVDVPITYRIERR